MRTKERKKQFRNRTRKLVKWERVVKMQESNDDWNIKFWQRVGVNRRFSTSWEMLKEYSKIRGKSGVKFRLQRSIENIKKI